MKHKLHIILLFISSVFAAKLLAQYPKYFSYDDENGLPSSEIYSIVQDNKGFIWFGCDAGLFKFDGVRYTGYKSATQTSKSFTSLVISPLGAMYCTNFQDQIFYIENDSLKELKHVFKKISNIAVDKNELLYVTHGNGISVFNFEKQKWKTISGIDDFARSVKVSNQNEVYFLSQVGIVNISGSDVLRLSKGKMKIIELPDEKNVASHFMLTCHKNEVWVFSRSDNTFYALKNGEIIKNSQSNLTLALQNRKITNVESLPDGNLWICTYNGVIRYNAANDSTQVFYPNLAFSDVLIDREGNYWLTTLQAGILRVPELNYLVWNGTNENIKNEKLTHLATDGKHIYFSSVNGHISKLNVTTNILQTFHTGNNADIESFDFAIADNRLYFSTQNKIYSLKNDKTSEESITNNALKSLLHIHHYYFFASSQGLYVQTDNHTEKISETWSRELVFDSLLNELWVASNKGLMRFVLQQNQWRCVDTLFANTQILSIDFDSINKQIFALSFDGKLYKVNHKTETSELARLPESVQASKLKVYNEKLYIATNNGVSIYDLQNHSFTTFNRMSGLTSDNVQDLLLLYDVLWLATGKGLQKILLSNNLSKTLAKVYLKNYNDNTQLLYNEPLILFPEASIYNALGNFEYAYRMGKNDWIKLPASVEQIVIQNLPTGKFTLELKVIDHLGFDSENVIFISGFVQPPFWKKWWFVALAVLGLSGLLFFIVKKIIADIRKREQEKNELLNSQLKAIRAQMNPHFMYNTLNSIQDLILQQDIKSTNYYLSRFSLLMRQILVFSEEEKILLSEEIEMLQNYLELEKLRFGDDFSFSLSVDEKLDVNRNYIPSLVVQPFVENAIKHGLLHKKGKKHLEVRFSYFNNTLEIGIEDNGVGRKRSAEIKQRSGFSHKSFASNAVQKRIDLLNKSGKHHIEIKTSDMDENDKNTGTKVRIKIRS